MSITSRFEEKQYGLAGKTNALVIGVTNLMHDWE